MKKISTYFFLLTVSILLIVSYRGISAEKKLSEGAERMKSYVQFLADDALEGRFPGTDGNTKAGDFILDKFKTFGLLPVNDNYSQEFPFRSGIKLKPENKLIFTKLIEKVGLPKELWTKAEKKWTPFVDYTPLGLSDNGTASGEIAFVGYGITAKDINYDDYEGIDVKGKIVIILSDSADGKPLDQRFTNYATLRYKATNAREHGASAIIFIKRLSDSANTFYPLKVDRVFSNAGIICVQGTRTEIAKYFPKDKNLYPVEMELMKSKKPYSFVLPMTTVSLTVNLEYENTNIRNILGMVKGNDPVYSNQYIIIGAHYDHLGWGGFNSMYRGGKPQIHNGADDNASGTSGLIELAERISKKPLRRNVIFMAFNAEEFGLLGSGYYIKNPQIPIENTIFMLNLDMIGRCQENKINVFGTGSSDYFDRMTDSLSILDSLTIIKGTEGYGPSDHSSFYGDGIPVLFLFTGAHSDYHSPADDWEKLNYEGLLRITEYAENIVNTIDSRDTKPNYIKVSGSQPNSGEKNDRGYGGVWFGIVPDFEENPKGMIIAGASAGSPAEKAGMKKGDILTMWNNKNIKNLRDLTTYLRESKPGDIVDITYIRDGIEKIVKVTLVKK